LIKATIEADNSVKKDMLFPWAPLKLQGKPLRILDVRDKAKILLQSVRLRKESSNPNMLGNIIDSSVYEIDINAKKAKKLFTARELIVGYNKESKAVYTMGDSSIIKHDLNSNKQARIKTSLWGNVGGNDYYGTDTTQGVVVSVLSSSKIIFYLDQVSSSSHFYLVDFKKGSAKSLNDLLKTDSGKNISSAVLSPNGSKIALVVQKGEISTFGFREDETVNPDLWMYTIASGKMENMTNQAYFPMQVLDWRE